MFTVDDPPYLLPFAASRQRRRISAPACPDSTPRNRRMAEDLIWTTLDRAFSKLDDLETRRSGDLQTEIESLRTIS